MWLLDKELNIRFQELTQFPSYRFDNQFNFFQPASKDQIVGIIEKARANLPAKPVKAKKAASAPAVSKSMKDDYDEPEAPPAKSRPAAAAASDTGDSKPAKTVKAKGKAAVSIILFSLIVMCFLHI